MAKKILEPIAGESFYNWTAIRRLGTTRNGTLWLCRCVCGKERDVRVTDLRRGRNRSCGCTRSYDHVTTHGKTDTAEYRIWRGMICRCHNPARSCFQIYGGRGISVCERWRKSFLDFLVDIGTRPSPRHSLERIN